MKQPRTPAALPAAAHKTRWRRGIEKRIKCNTRVEMAAGVKAEMARRVVSIANKAQAAAMKMLLPEQRSMAPRAPPI